MFQTARASRREVVCLLVAGLCFAFALAANVAFAQEEQAEDELSATIRASLLADPNTASLSPEELDALIEALAAEAGDEGVTSHDIVWQPEETFEPVVSVSESADMCGNVPPLLCRLNQLFGFSGNSTAPMILLGASLVVLILLLIMLELHRHKHTHPPAQSSGGIAMPAMRPVSPPRPPMSPRPSVPPPSVQPPRPPQQGDILYR